MTSEWVCHSPSKNNTNREALLFVGCRLVCQMAVHFQLMYTQFNHTLYILLAYIFFCLCCGCSPVIKAASEKLSALSGVEPKKPQGLAKKSSPSNSAVVSGLPSASDEVLEAQKKRFEELKVHV